MSKNGMTLEEKLKTMPFHAMEMCKLRSAEQVSQALLLILQDLQAYNEYTEVQSYITEVHHGKDRSTLDELILILDGLLDKGYKNRANLFDAYYWAINDDAKKLE